MLDCEQSEVAQFVLLKDCSTLFPGEAARVSVPFPENCFLW